MAITAAKLSNPGLSGIHETAIVSVKGSWETANSNISATAQSASDLIRPGAVTASNIVPVKLGSRVTRALLRVRYGAAGALTTPPVFRLIGAYGAGLCETSLPDDATVRYVILASAQTITPAPTTDVRDGTYSYSAPLSLTGNDLLGADYLLAFCETAAVIAGVGNIAEVLLLN